MMHKPGHFDVVTVGERGQVVIPATIRRDLGIKPGDQLVAFTRGSMIGLMPSSEMESFMAQM